MSLCLVEQETKIEMAEWCLLRPLRDIVGEYLEIECPPDLRK